MKVKNLIGYFFAAMAIIIWGNTFVSTKILLSYMSPMVLTVIRFFLAYLILLIIHPKFPKLKTKKEEFYFMLLGMTGVSLNFLFENYAIKYSTASNVSLIVSLSPIATIILAHFITKDEEISSKVAIGAGVAAIGVALVVLNGKTSLSGLNPGDFLAIVSAFMWAFYSIIVKKIGDSYSSIYINRKMFLYGALFSLPFAFFEKQKIDFSWIKSDTAVINMLFLGVAASALCYVIWYKAINIIGIVKTNYFVYFLPVVTIISSAIFTGEKITLMILAGAVLIIGGVYIGERRDIEINIDKG